MEIIVYNNAIPLEYIEVGVMGFSTDLEISKHLVEMRLSEMFPYFLFYIDIEQEIVIFSESRYLEERKLGKTEEQRFIIHVAAVQAIADFYKLNHFIVSSSTGQEVAITS